MTLLPTSPTFVKTMMMSSKSSSFSTTQHQKSVFLQHSRRRREHQQQRNYALNFIVQSSKHHHHHHRSLVQTQHHHLKKTSTKSVLRASSKDETTTEKNNDETMKDVQVTLVDCVASDGAKMTKETRRNAEGSIEEMDNCRFVRHRFNWWTTHQFIKNCFFLNALALWVSSSSSRQSTILFLWVESFE